MIRKNLTISFALCALAAIITTDAFASGHKSGNCDWKEKNDTVPYSHAPIYSLEDRLFYESGVYLQWREELSLSEEQVDRVMDIKSTLKKDLILKKAEIKAIKVDIHAELRRDQLNAKAMQQHYVAKYDAKKEYAGKLVQRYNELRSILNADQQQKIEELYSTHTSICPYSGQLKQS